MNETLAYARIGQGKPLMLIHGFPLDRSIWDETAELLKNDFDLILPDLRGFGASSATDEAYTLTDMADDLAALCDALGVEKISLAGHSMGGYAALAFAAKYPQRVGGLALVGSQTLADTPERKAGRYQTARQVADGGMVVLADAMSAKFSASEQTRSAIRSTIMRQSQTGAVGALKAMAERADMTAAFAAFDFPRILIHGDQDELIPVERAREARAANPSAALSELAGIGHAPMMDAARQTAAALKLLK